LFGAELGLLEEDGDEAVEGIDFVVAEVVFGHDNILLAHAGAFPGVRARFRVVKGSLTTEFSTSSPSSTMFLACSETFCFVVWKSSAISSCESQTVASSTRRSRRVRASADV
jgi:hypothetical protein